MLVAAMAPNATLLIDRILNAPFVPPVQAGNGKIPCLVPGLEELRKGSMRCETGEFAPAAVAKPEYLFRVSPARSLSFLLKFLRRANLCDR